VRNSSRGIFAALIHTTEGTMGVILYPAACPYAQPVYADSRHAAREKVGE